MPSSSAPSVLDRIAALPATAPEYFTQSDVVRVVEVARKYAPEGENITRVPEYTNPGGPNTYHCSKVETAWTQGFFPGLLWLLVERERLLPGSVTGAGYEIDEIIKYARRYQESFRFMARPAQNHDQGFRFQLCYGRDLLLTGNEDVRQVVIDAAESLLDRYDETVGCIRSWDAMVKPCNSYRRDNRHEHYLVIIDNMMNLDLLFEATEMTGDKRYANTAIRQAEQMQHAHIRPNGTTYHVVDFKTDGTVRKAMTQQGYADESCWSRGQAWAIYGYAQVALRTKRTDFIATTRKLADAFLERLGESGVPMWDFDAPEPKVYDSSAGVCAARGMQMLYELLKDSDAAAAENYLARAFKLIDDTVRECASPAATNKGGVVNWGEGGWETILQHATINANPLFKTKFMDHGLVYADYYFVEFANEAIKLKNKVKA